MARMTVPTAALLAGEEGGLTSVVVRSAAGWRRKEVAGRRGTRRRSVGPLPNDRIVDRFLNGETIALPKVGTSPTTASGRRWSAVLDLLDPRTVERPRDAQDVGASTDTPGMERDASGYGLTMQAMDDDDDGLRGEIGQSLVPRDGLAVVLMGLLVGLGL